MQLGINIIVSVCLIVLAAAGISLVHATTRQIPFTLAAAMSTAAYACHGLHQAGWPLIAAAVVAIAMGTSLACILDVVVIRTLMGCASPAWAALAVSLAAYILIQSTLAIAFGEAGRTFNLPRESFRLGSGSISEIQLASVCISSGTIAALFAFLAFMRTGLAVRGLASNVDLCGVLGIDIILVRRRAVGVGGALTSVAAILLSCDSGLVPSTGFSLFMSGAIAAILGGVGSTRGIAAGAVLLAAATHLVAYFGDPKWTAATAFAILIGFLMCRPLGFSGRRLREVEL